MKSMGWFGSKKKEDKYAPAPAPAAAAAAAAATAAAYAEVHGDGYVADALEGAGTPVRNEDEEGAGTPAHYDDEEGSFEAWAYTGPLFSSTRAVSDTHKTPDTP